MPQLNPAPWLLIFLFSWLVLLVFIPPKILKHYNTKPPSPKTSQKTENPFWPWPSL
uniref:ATP synthase complex subunit 8 n=1 Tax=Symphurus plagiusa TaxID=637534 RepID=W5QKF6_9PLEU|nr:ATP synthase F0 subunit 8 [Symphurus plagiusa]